MNKCDSVFDPELSLLLTQAVEKGDKQSVNLLTDSRALFYNLNQPQHDIALINQSYHFIKQGLNDISQNDQVSFNQIFNRESLLSLTNVKIEPIAELFQTTENISQCIHQAAAIYLTQPCWLKNISQISSCQSNFSIQIIALYLDLVKHQPGEPGLSAQYHSLLLSKNQDTPVLYHYNYCQGDDIPTVVFEFAAIQLSLARFPRVFFPEILGFTLAYLQTPSVVEGCFTNRSQQITYFQQRNSCLSAQLNVLINCINDYLVFFVTQKKQLWVRIQQGFYLYQLQTQKCCNHFKAMSENSISTDQAVAQLFQKKVSAALGHHKLIVLNGKPLDDWFASLPERINDFLLALRQSKYVNQQAPADSKLLKLFTFNGPMFGVLDEAEITVLKNWLTNKERVVVIHTTNDVSTTTNSSAIEKACSKAINPYKHLNNRSLYYYLLNADLFPDVMPTAESKAARVLKMCSIFCRPPFKEYSHEKFDAYIEHSYQQEIVAYQPLQGKPKFSKQAYIWGLEQIAPMILIDGCWLQHGLAIENTNPEISKILFSIYSDEIGNGHLQQNHPYIFQQLLNSLSIDVPPVYSRDFVKHVRFINSAFDLPVYMLSLSCFPLKFLPELLGLNMAIELSGLGQGYMGLVDDWTYWGIDPAIAKIHISIDNFASGHTFLAKQAIHSYMDNVIQGSDDVKILNQHWQRIFNGYSSLQLAGSRFKMALPIGYWVNKKNNNV